MDTIVVRSNDPLDLRPLAGRHQLYRHAWISVAAHDQAAVSAKSRVRPVDALDRHTEWRMLAARRAFDLLEMFEQGLSLVPGHALGAENDIVTVARRQRDAHDVVDIDGPRKGPDLALESSELGFGPIDEIHLVDRDDEAADAQRGDDHGVTHGLPRQTIGCADQKQGEVGGRGA